MRKISADVIFPISSPPIENGVVIIEEDGIVLSIEENSNVDPASVEKFKGIICPGFINAHCHLELSYMKEKIPEKKGLTQFIIDLIDYRNGFFLSNENDERTDIIISEIRNGEEEMRRNGIVGVGDISNDDYTFLAKEKTSLRYHTFIECFGFFPEKAEKYFHQSVLVFEKARAHQLAASITPHAPYSVPPELFHQIFSFAENHPALFSFHNQESADEATFFKNGSGKFLDVFDHFKMPPSIFKPTGKNSIESVINQFPEEGKTLFVHNTFSTENDVDLILHNLPQAFFCFCPLANLYIETRLPDFSLFKKCSSQLCIGTDSYASNRQLSVLEEIKAIQLQQPSISTSELLQWSTLNGAKFFNWDRELGSIEAGKKPGLNLISNLDASLQFTTQSMVEKLI